MATVEVFGETFGLNPEVSEFALMEFADAAASGEDGDTMTGMASLYRLVQACIVDGDWHRFRTLARKNRAKQDDLMPVIRATFEQVTERPTGLPSGSSDGQPSIEPNAEPNAEDRASAAFSGRPDLQLAVLRARSA